VTQKKYALKDLLLFHELAFILLISLAVTVGAIGIHLQEKSSQESQRIQQLVQEVQQTRGHLYRQMKELFDAYFLEDMNARSEYNHFTVTVEANFEKLHQLAMGDIEKKTIQELHTGYQTFIFETSALFDQHGGLSHQDLKNC